MADPAAHSQAIQGVDRREDAIAIVRRLREADHIAYFAGGCVRDELLGLVPKDYDIATDATPDVVRDLFGNKRTQAVGAAFGVILVREQSSVIEVATFRTDGGYSDGRRPDSVRFTNAQEDAFRRDFTINGLFHDPLAALADEEDDGIIDFVGGKRDLKDRILRCIGKPAHRFDEDYLRMVRAVRFGSRFGFTIHPDTFEAIKDFGPRLAAISPERVGEEVRRMLTSATRGEAWRLLWETRLIQTVFRTIPSVVSEGLHRPFTRHVANIKTDINFGLALAATAADLLLHAGLPVADIFAPNNVRETAAALKLALRLSNTTVDDTSNAMHFYHLLGERSSVSVAQLRRFLAQPGVADAREMLDAIAVADASLAAHVAWLREQFAQYEPLDNAPPPLVTGDDLVAAGVQPGPHFKRALDAAYDAQLEDRVEAHKDALVLALRVARE